MSSTVPRSSVPCTSYVMSNDGPATVGMARLLRRERAGHALDAVDERGLEHVGRAGDLDVGQTSEELAEHRGHLPSGQVRTEAEVRTAGTEADLLAGGTKHV